MVINLLSKYRVSVADLCTTSGHTCCARQPRVCLVLWFDLCFSCVQEGCVCYRVSGTKRMMLVASS